MTDFELGTETGGVALVLGYLLILLVLFRRPAQGLEAALAGIQPLVHFLVLPIGGVVVGLYASLDGPNSGPFLFVAANYMAVFGLGLAIGVGSGTSVGIFQVVGLVLFVLSVVAMVVSPRRLAVLLGFDSAGASLR